MIIAVTDEYTLAVTYILAGLLGLCIGSFLNVVIYRVPENMSLASPPSHCPSCGYRLKWYDNIPIISYCILGGKCRSCQRHISFRYTAVEIGNTLLWLASALLFAQTNYVYLFIACIASSVCLCMFFVDIEHMIIPDSFQIALAIPALAAVFFDGEFGFVSHLIGMVAAAVVFIGVALIMSRILGRDALGGGDIKLAVIAGLLLGWQKLLLMMLIASVSGAVYMSVRRIRDKESREIPFAPFLTVGLVISMFAGDFIVNSYVSLLTGLI